MYKGLLTTILLIMSVSTFGGVQSICGAEDNRVPSFENEIGRLFAGEKHAGCTVTMISEDCGITAGHCKSVLKFAEFNTPASIDGIPQASAPEDVYAIDQDSIVSMDDGPGNDWAVMKLKPNELTGKLPGAVQGFHEVSFITPRKKSILSITGYGRDLPDHDRNFAQQTNSGRLEKIGGFWYGKTVFTHTVDTMGGNSGSTVIDVASNKIIGIHTHGGCTSTGGSNMGTLISKHDELKAAIRACLSK